jgi:hypothetical protein
VDRGLDRVVSSLDLTLSSVHTNLNAIFQLHFAIFNLPEGLRHSEGQCLTGQLRIWPSPWQGSYRKEAPS